MPKKNFLRKKKRSEGLNQKRKEGFLTALTTAIENDTTKLIRKYSNELKVKEKTVRRVIKQVPRPEHNPLDYAIWGVLGNKTNLTSHPNIGSIKTAIEEEEK